ncbi:MAG TPA: hypothetical protein EYG68_04705 [Leucothrix mucor]|nr:hypothetical protein [Leucothrix mucor]
MGNDISSIESVSQEKVESTGISNSSAVLKLASVILGGVFGFLLVSIGATTFDIQAKMFLFQDFQLPIVLGMAVFTGATGMWMLARMEAKTLVMQDEISHIAAKITPHLVVGSLIFGIGWALTASCPGTALTMLGEGKMTGIPVVLGIFIGTLLFGIYNKRSNSSN